MKQTFIIFASIMIWMEVMAQDPHFTHIAETSVWINPAYTGLFVGDVRGIMGYRDQWRSIGAPYTTFFISGDGIISQGMRSQLSIGGYGIFDQSGVKSFKQLYGGISFSAHVKVGESVLVGAGIMTGIFNMSFTPQDWAWPSQYDGMHYDPTLPSQENIGGESITKLDVGTGIVVHFMQNTTNPFSNDGIKGKIGVSFYHINRPEQFSILVKDKKYLKTQVQGDLSIGLPNTNTAVKPGFLFAKQGPHMEFSPGLLIRYMLKEQSRYTGYVKNSALTIGSYLRLRDAVSILTGLEFSSYQVGFSYDINVSGLTKASKGSGAMEIFIRAIYPAPDKMKRGSSPIF